MQRKRKKGTLREKERNRRERRLRERRDRERERGKTHQKVIEPFGSSSKGLFLAKMDKTFQRIIFIH